MNERKTSKKAGYPNGDARDFFYGILTENR